jgi:hypothetical protein
VRAPLTLALVLALATSGCVGGHESKRSSAEKRGNEVDRERAERVKALHGVPREDRTAFFQIATATGGGRARAALLTLGERPQHRSKATLKATAARLRVLRPRNPVLQRLRRRALALVRRALAAPTTGPAAKAAGRRVLRESDRLSRRLDLLLRDDPRFSALVPD